MLCSPILQVLFHYILHLRNCQLCLLYQQINHIDNTCRLSVKRSVADLGWGSYLIHESGYGWILGHTVLFNCTIEGSLIYKSKLSQDLFKAGPPHSWRIKLSNRTLPAGRATDYRNAVLFVLIWIPFPWASAYLHPTPTVNSFKRPPYNLECVSSCHVSIDGFCSATTVHTPCKCHASMFCNLQLSPKYPTILCQHFF